MEMAGVDPTLESLSVQLLKIKMQIQSELKRASKRAHALHRRAVRNDKRKKDRQALREAKEKEREMNKGVGHGGATEGGDAEAAGKENENEIEIEIEKKEQEEAEEVTTLPPRFYDACKVFVLFNSEQSQRACFPLMEFTFQRRVPLHHALSRPQPPQGLSSHQQ